MLQLDLADFFAPDESHDDRLVTVGDHEQACILVSPSRGASGSLENCYDCEPSDVEVSRLSVHRQPTPSSEHQVHELDLE